MFEAKGRVCAKGLRLGQAARAWLGPEGLWGGLIAHLFHHGMQSHSGEVELTQHHAQDLAGPGGKDTLSAPPEPGSWEGTPAPAHPKTATRWPCAVVKEMQACGVSCLLTSSLPTPSLA